MSTTDRISIRDHMVWQAANGGPFFDALHDLDIAAIELQIDIDFTIPHLRQADGVPFSADTKSAITSLRKALADAGVRVSALLLMTDFSSEQAAIHVRWAVRAIELAAELGAPVIRLDPLTQNRELSRETVRNNFIARVRQVLDQTENSTVDIGIENHGPFGNDPIFLDEIFAAVANPRLGMTLDMGNFYWWGAPLDELYTLLERYAPRAKHTHIKNINYPPDLANAMRPVGLDYAKYCCPLDEGNINLRRVARIVNKAGYRGGWCIENEALNKYSAEQRLDVLKRDVAAIKIAFS